ncbi:MAG TPA: DUF1150 family protein [Alphaproteobacteria bacterium]|nr:DUF1150 family protein [Alphaproteobacteria bacterium]
MTEKTSNVPTTEGLRALSRGDFLNFGLHQVAYVRPVTVENRRVWAIHAADGTPLHLADSPQTAGVLIRQNDLEPMTVQ